MFGGVQLNDNTRGGRFGLALGISVSKDDLSSMDSPSNYLLRNSS